MRHIRTQFSRARRLAPLLVVLLLSLSFDASADNDQTLEGTPEEDLSPGIRLRIVSCGYQEAQDLPVGNPSDDDDSSVDDDDSSVDDDDSGLDDDDSAAADDDDSAAADDDDSAVSDDDDSAAADDDDSAVSDDDDSAAPDDDDSAP